MSELLDYQLVRDVQEQVADLLTVAKQRRKAAGQLELAPVDEEQLALSFIDAEVKRHMHGELAAGRDLPAASYDQRLADAVFASMYQAGELQELLEDERVEDIDINGADEVWITYADQAHPVRGRPVAATDEDLVAIVQNLAAYSGINPRPFSVAAPVLDLRLHDGSRLTALLSAGARPAVSIRRNRYPQMFLATLVELGTVSEHLAAFLSAAVAARLNLMIAGGVGAGKTTLLRALINCVPASERIITIERSLELGLRRTPELHPNVLEWEEVLPDAEGQGGLSLDDLVLRSRRHHPQRVIMGEIMGPEVISTLSAMSQGNDGSLSTLHAKSADDVFNKLSTYGAQYGHLTVDTMQPLIAAGVDLVVFIRQTRQQDSHQPDNDLTSSRSVVEVLEVTGMGESRVATSQLFAPSPVGGPGPVGGAGPTDGVALRTETPIARFSELAEAGYDDTLWPSYSMGR